MVKIINYGKHHIDKKDINAAIKQLKSNSITQGKKINEFEKKLCNKINAKYCCVTSNGTASLHLIALALGWKKNDIIITTPLSFLATSNCIEYVGASTAFVDIDPKSYCIDPIKVENKIKELKVKKKKVKAIIAVDFAGNPCDWIKLKKIAIKYNLKLINDFCHSLGAEYEGTIKYSLKYADVASLSFHAVKNITTGEGGAVLTNNKKLNDKISILRSHGIERNNYKIKKKGLWYNEMRSIGYNYRLTDFQCALGISQLSKLKKFISKKRKIAKLYDEVFRDNSNFCIPKSTKNSKHAYHLYPLQINFKKFKISKKNFFKKMYLNGIKLQVHYIPIHYQPYYKKKYSYKKGDFPVAEKFYENEVSLPIFYDLNIQTQKKILKIIKKILI